MDEVRQEKEGSSEKDTRKGKDGAHLKELFRIADPLNLPEV